MKQGKVSRGTVTLAPADIEMLRPGEEPLGSLTSNEKSWLATAYACLARIYENRQAGSPGNGAFCVFAFGKIYVQFLASWNAERLLCEAVSEKTIPDISRILLTEGNQALLRLGFEPPEISPNYSQTLKIEGSRDLGYAARLAFRVLKNVYRVEDFSSAVFRERIPESTATLEEAESGGSKVAERKREAEQQAVCNAIEWFDDTIATLENKAHRLRDFRERFVHMLGREGSPESAELVGWYVGAASQSLGLARFDLAFSRGIELANAAPRPRPAKA